MLSPLHKKLLNDYQQDFPLSPTPYQDIADSIGSSEDEVIAIFKELSDEKFIARIGSIITPNKILCNYL